MTELLDAVEAALDPNDPVHAEYRDAIKRQRELNDRCATLRDEVRRLAYVDRFASAELKLAELEGLMEEGRALNERLRRFARHLHPSTETAQ